MFFHKIFELPIKVIKNFIFVTVTLLVCHLCADDGLGLRAGVTGRDDVEHAGKKKKRRHRLDNIPDI